MGWDGMGRDCVHACIPSCFESKLQDNKTLLASDDWGIESLFFFSLVVFFFFSRSREIEQS